MQQPLRLAMWSGPRNISTAFMRAWENRDDTFVIDEPFYAHYLQETGISHPGAAEIITECETDWRQVVEHLLGDIPQGKAIFYQKQMAHHLLPDIGREWLNNLTHAFLIRDPREMITSFIKVFPGMTLEMTGLPQQVEIFEQISQATGTTPPVLDTVDILNNPEQLLRLLCEQVGIEFSDTMLTWPAGKRASDGMWATHWYKQVESSTCFRPYQPKPDEVPDELQGLYEESCVLYQKLYAHRLGQ